MKLITRTETRPAVTLAALILLWMFTVPAHATTNGAGSLVELRQRLASQIAQERFISADWGVKIVSLDTGRVLFEHQPRKLLSPASNCKLYTVALGLDELGGDHRIRTSLYSTEKPNRRGTLDGDLIVYGRGDPTLNARLNGGDIFRALQPLVAALTNAGVHRVAGNLVADESFLRGAPFGSGWTWDDLENYYGAEISALTINDNTLRLTVSPGGMEGGPCIIALSPQTSQLIVSNATRTIAARSRQAIRLSRAPGSAVLHLSGSMPVGGEPFTETVTVPAPAKLFAELFREALARNGVKVSGKTRVVNSRDRESSPLILTNLIELGSIESPPLRDIAREIQKPSQNLYTDLLLAYVGELRRSPDNNRDTSEDSGIRALDKFLTRIGVREGDVRFEEGSGLSRNNLATPDATIALLRHMSRHAEAQAYLDALPVAGVDGTLRNRFKNTVAAGNIRAKTGTLRWANSLSGHVTTARDERLVFCVMLNRYAAPDAEHSARAEIDKLALELVMFRGRSDE